jgi:hypothetical protein
MCVVMCSTGRDIAKTRIFGNGGLICIRKHTKNAKDTRSHLRHRFIMIFDPRNMGLEPLIMQLSAILAVIWRTLDFPVMAALICIKMICGTFSRPCNKAYRILRIFFDLKTSI